MSIPEAMNAVYLLLKIVQISISIYQSFIRLYRSSEYLKNSHDNCRKNKVFLCEKNPKLTVIYIRFFSKEKDQKNVYFRVLAICSICIQLLLFNNTNKLSVQDGNPHAHD
jgi:sortase (surface protein transpeptidase)